MPPAVVPIGLALLCAHVLVDFVVQSDRDVERKARLRPTAFLVHGLQHAVAVWLLVGVWMEWRIPIAVFVAHVAIDLAKETARTLLAGRGMSDARALRLFSVDQLLHLVSIVVIARWFGPTVDSSFWATRLGPEHVTPILIVVIGVVVAVRTGGIVVALAVRRFRYGLQSPTEDVEIRPEPRGLSGGGAMIGALERALVFFFVLTGMPEGVGLLLAAKSILRFGDLNARQQRMETEYVIIGTLASFAWSLITAWLTLQALTTIS